MRHSFVGLLLSSLYCSRNTRPQRNNTAIQILAIFQYSEEISIALYRFCPAEFGGDRGVFRILASRKVFEKNGTKDLNINAH